MTIRKISIEDWQKLQEIGKQTFYETFAESNSAEDMQRYLEESFAEEKVKNELSNPNSEFYFAEIDDEVVGYLKLNFGTSQTELQDNNAVEIERIYVLKTYHGQKVGQLLYDKAIEVAQNKQAEYVWLGVWEENPRAIRFYEKNGFVAFDKHIFKLGNDEQTDIMMRKNLRVI